jgi:integrase
MSTPASLSAAALRQLLSLGDLAGFLDALSPLLPGAPGDRTHQNNLSGLRVYLGWTQGEGLALLSPAPGQAAAYRTWLEGQYAPATVKNRLSQVRHLYDVLQELGLVEHHSFRDVSGPPNRAWEHRAVYSPEEVTRLLAHAGVEERALVLLGAHGGLTGPEVLALRFEHLRLERGELAVAGRVVEGSAALLGALEAWGRTQGHTALFSAQGPVFDLESASQLRRRVWRLCRRANVPYRAWQALRNAAGVRLLGLTPDREGVQAQLGLADPESLRPLVKLSGRSRHWRKRQRGNSTL